MTRSFIIIILLAVLPGCELVNNLGDSREASPVQILDSNGSFSEIPAGAVTVKDILLEGNFLVLDVSYSGGCEEHEFTLYAERGFVETNPPGAEVYVSHESNGDACRQFIEETLVFNIQPLVPLFKSMYPGSDAFYVNVHAPTGEPGAFEHVELRKHLYRL